LNQVCNGHQTEAALDGAMLVVGLCIKVGKHDNLPDKCLAGVYWPTTDLQVTCLIFDGIEFLFYSSHLIDTLLFCGMNTVESCHAETVMS
jgi:hypothetical protein